MIKTKHIWMNLLFIMCCFFSFFEYNGTNISFQQTQAAEVDEIDNGDKDYIYEEYKKDQLSQAIVKLYKHISVKEALEVVNYVFKYSEIYGVDPSLLIGVIASESSFKRKAVSKEGAAGYTQVLAKYHKDKLKGRNIFHPGVNIEVGTIILSDCLSSNNSFNKALGCYNGTKDKNKIAKFKSVVNKRSYEIFQLAKL